MNDIRNRNNAGYDDRVRCSGLLDLLITVYAIDDRSNCWYLRDLKAGSLFCVGESSRSMALRKHEMRLGETVVTLSPCHAIPERVIRQTQQKACEASIGYKKLGA